MESPHKDSSANVCVYMITIHERGARVLEIKITRPGCDWSSFSSTLAGRKSDNANVSIVLIT